MTWKRPSRKLIKLVRDEFQKPRGKDETPVDKELDRIPVGKDGSSLRTVRGNDKDGR